MGREALKLSFWAIAIYLGVAYASNFGNDIKQGGAAGAGLVKAFQGR